MKSLELTSSSEFANWLIFLAVVLAVGLGIGGFVFWTMVMRGATGKRHRKRSKHRRHKRQHNPTLAEAGGLPPKREGDQPTAEL